MFLTARNIEGFKVEAPNGAKGRVKDVYFDDQEWRIKYFVLNLGGKTFSSEVALSANLVERIDVENREIVAALPASDFGCLPFARMVKPVCQQYGAGNPSSAKQARKLDPYLRSAGAVLGYAVEDRGAALGELEDLVFDPIIFQVRYLQVRKSLERSLSSWISTRVIERISFTTHRISLRPGLPAEMSEFEPMADNASVA